MISLFCYRVIVLEARLIKKQGFGKNAYSAFQILVTAKQLNTEANRIRQ